MLIKYSILLRHYSFKVSYILTNRLFNNNHCFAHTVRNLMSIYKDSVYDNLHIQLLCSNSLKGSMISVYKQE